MGPDSGFDNTNNNNTINPYSTDNFETNLKKPEFTT